MAGNCKWMLNFPWLSERSDMIDGLSCGGGAEMRERVFLLAAGTRQKWILQGRWTWTLAIAV